MSGTRVAPASVSGRPLPTRLRPGVAVAALLALLTALFFWRLTFAGEVLFWGMPLLQFFPWRSFAVQEYLRGELPLWNPYAGLGSPLAANLQSGVFYPLNLHYLLMPVERAMTVSLLSHVLLAGLFTYGFVRALRASVMAGLVAGLSFMFSGFLIAQGGFHNVVSTIAWAPALFLGVHWLAAHRWNADRGQRAHIVWGVVGLAVATTMLLLAGFIQSAYYGMLAATAYALYRAFALTNREPWAPRLRQVVVKLLPVGFAMALGIGLAALQLLPTYELSKESIRQEGLDFLDATSYSVFPGQLLTFVIPTFFGSQANGDWWGPGAAWEGVLYIGVLPLLLALAGVWRSPTPGRKFFIVLVLAGLFLAMGRYNPLFQVVLSLLPGVASFHAPARFVLWVALSIAVLAGLGYDALRDSPHRTRRLGIAAVLVGLGLPLGSAAPMFVGSGGVADTALRGLLPASGWLVISGAVLFVRTRLPDSIWRPAVVLVILADLYIFGQGLNPTTGAELYRASPPATTVALREQAGLDRTFVSEASYWVSIREFFSFYDFKVTRWQDLWQMREALVPNVGTVEGLYEVHNYDPLRLGRPWQLLKAAEEARAPGPLLDMMGVRFVVDRTGYDGGGQSWGEAGPATVYGRPDPLPRAYMVTKAVAVPDKTAAMTRISASGFDPRREVVLEAPSDALNAGQGEAISGLANSARILEYQPQRVRILAATSGGGVLVLADSYYPGWRATLDDRPAPIWPANGALRGVVLPPGEHEVEFRYQPDSFRLGLLVSGGALLLVAMLVVLGLRWRAAAASEQR